MSEGYRSDYGSTFNGELAKISDAWNHMVKQKDGQISELQSRLSSSERKNTDLQDEIAKLQEEIRKREGENSQLQRENRNLAQFRKHIKHLAEEAESKTISPTPFSSFPYSSSASRPYSLESQRSQDTAGYSEPSSKRQVMTIAKEKLSREEYRQFYILMQQYNKLVDPPEEYESELPSQEKLKEAIEAFASDKPELQDAIREQLTGLYLNFKFD